MTHNLDPATLDVITDALHVAIKDTRSREVRTKVIHKQMTLHREREGYYAALGVLRRISAPHNHAA